MKEKALNLLGLMRRAQAVQIGEVDSGVSCRAQTAKLVILASDASENALKRAKGFVYGRDIPLIRVPFTKAEIQEHVGKNGCSMAAISDLGFADAFVKLLNEISDNGFTQEAEAIGEKLRKQKEQKRGKTAHETKKHTGKRRNNA